MGKIKVAATVGDTIHPKYGLLTVGQQYEIDEEEFGDEIFEKQVEAQVEDEHKPLTSDKEE